MRKVKCDVDPSLHLCAGVCFILYLFTVYDGKKQTAEKTIENWRTEKTRSCSSNINKSV